MHRPTIFAPSTSRGRGAIAIFRLSGQHAHVVIEELTRETLPNPRRLVRRDVYDGQGELLDSAMVVISPEGRSYTGEPMAEIHCHGGPAVINAMIDRLSAFASCRLAEPGEFTLRAFQSGRMDLSEVEGLSDLINAETELQRRQAIRVSKGAIARKADEWRKKLLEALSLIEVTIDWVDEEVPEDVYPTVSELLLSVLKSFDHELALSERAERLRVGFEVALVGPPNVGKSTLLNALLGREISIASDIAGTTRDVIEGVCDLRGLPVRFLDMAGIRETQDPIEVMGVERARSRSAEADLRIHLRSADGLEIELGDSLTKDTDIYVLTKADLLSPHETPRTKYLAVSAITGSGLKDLEELILSRLLPKESAVGLFAHERQSKALMRARGSLVLTLEHMETVTPELLSEDLRMVISELESIVGRINVDDVLSEVFSTFCLGK